MSLANSLYIMSIYKSQLYLQLRETKIEKRNFKINVIYNSTWKHELGINLIKYTLDLHVRNNKALMKEI